MKKTLITLTIIIVAILAYGVYNKLNKGELPTVKDLYQIEIEAIMEEPNFKASVELQAKRIHAERAKQAIEKKLEELRKAELELIASSTTSLKE